jgi:autotransporter-associated beta strand protein
MGSDNVTMYYALQLSSGELVPGLSTVSSPTGNSNVQVTSNVTIGGSWSALTNGTYTFTPNADNANINVSDITNRLRGSGGVGTAGSVKIVTTNVSGTQVGNVNFVVGVSAQNVTTSRYSLQVVAGGDIVVGGSLSLDGGSWNQQLNYGYDIDFSAGGNLLVNNTITTSGGGAATSSIVYSNGGNVLLSASGYVRVAGSIITSGGLNSSNVANVNSNGGWVSITGAGGVTMSADITTFNGRSGIIGYGTNGLITISSGNSVMSSGSGGGVNDGQVSGLLRGGDFVKSGVGVFVIKGSNLYTGSTSVSGGVLRLGGNNSIPTGSALSVVGTLDMGGYNQTVRTLSGGGLVMSSGSGTLVLTVSDNGETTTYSGVIENGSASSVGLSKTGSGTLVLSGSSTYTGATLVNQGVLDVRHSNGLGVSSLTTVSSGASLQLRGGISIGSLALRLTGTGVSADGALRNMSGNNSWGGLVTLLTSTTRINSESGVLTLGGSSSISSTNIGLQVGGSGGQLTVSGAMSLGSGTLFKDGGSTLVLGGVNVYSGTTSVNGGVLRVSNSSGLGSSAVTVNGNNTLELVGGVSVGNTLSLSGSGVSSGGALRSVSGNNSWTGTITINSSVTRINSDADVLDIVGVMSGTGGVRYGGSGTVDVSGTSTYTGVTEVASGATLLLGNNNVLSSSSNVLFSGGRLSSDGKNVSVGTLSVSSVSELLLGSGSHEVRFSGGGTFSFTRLLIKGWQGVYGGSGSSGTDGRVYVGSSGGVLSREQLDQIQFMGSDNVTMYYALQLSSGEVVPGLSTVSSPTGNSNVQVTSNVTIGGSWSALTNGTYTFTPSADNANINVGDITNRLRGAGGVGTAGSVKIVTTNVSGTQVGNVNFVVSVSAQNGTTSRYTLQVVAGGDIVVGSSLSLGGSTWSVNNYGYNVDFSAVGNIMVNSIIESVGLVTYTGSTVYSSGGDITLSAGGYTKVGSSISVNGGSNTYPGGGSSSSGGSVSISGVGGVTIAAGITALGSGGMNGAITVSSGNVVATSGGGSGVNDGQVSGVLQGGSFTKSGAGVFVIKGSNGYTGSTSVSGGVLRLGSNNTLPTSTALTLSGGTLNTGGFSQTVASISITNNSIIELNSAVHTFTSTAIGSFASGKNLTINGWEGTYAAPGSSAVKGKIIINGTALSSTILGQIKFFNVANLIIHSAIQLGTKEVVPGN